MNDNALLKQIGTLIDEKLVPIKKQLDKVEMKVELVNKKVDLVDKKIDKAQQETIETLSALIHTGYNLHEERITKIEKQLQSS